MHSAHILYNISRYSLPAGGPGLLRKWPNPPTVGRFLCCCCCCCCCTLGLVPIQMWVRDRSYRCDKLQVVFV
ncbi:hypothetical protein JOB18_017856 [Solea senegalensis]|uniref:Uncharacterized protein n=1 Tax=Solea senegalensis TaxID=28829 RepID=A0AAV6QHY3_SOLSE|nr:hypothetical protein JOB18_017856 [Solea senegalensis]